MKYGLPDKTIQKFESIFRKYPGIKEAILYGSRGKGKPDSSSDIDLSLKTDGTLTQTDILGVTGDFNDPDIPYFVDISIYDRISDPELKAHIDRVGKVLYRSDN